MAKWIQMPAHDFVKFTDKEVSGVRLNVMLSPFDVPRRIRGDYNITINRFVIDFEYLEHEKTELQKLDENVSLDVGQNSGRIRRILIDVKRLNATSVGLGIIIQAVDKALDELSSELGNERGEHYDLIKQVVASKRKQLFSDYRAAA